MLSLYLLEETMKVFLLHFFQDYSIEKDKSYLRFIFFFILLFLFFRRDTCFIHYIKILYSLLLYVTVIGLVIGILFIIYESIEETSDMKCLIFGLFRGFLGDFF